MIYIFGSYLRLSSHAWRSVYVQQQEDEKSLENDAKIKIKKLGVCALPVAGLQVTRMR